MLLSIEPLTIHSNSHLQLCHVTKDGVVFFVVAEYLQCTNVGVVEFRCRKMYCQKLTKEAAEGIPFSGQPTN